MDTDDSDNEEGFHCRRFRILVMGKAGVGKSTLLSRVFGVPEDIVGLSFKRICKRMWVRLAKQQNQGRSRKLR
jgi:predicted GTPase